MIREKKLRELYNFAQRYAHSFRNSYVEVDDLAHEMMLAVMKVKWVDDAYATRVMRNRFYDLMKHGKVERRHYAAIEGTEAQSQYVCEESKWEARIMVDRLMRSLPPKQAKVLTAILKGMESGVSRMTEHRYLRKARELSVR